MRSIPFLIFVLILAGCTGDPSPSWSPKPAASTIEGTHTSAAPHAVLNKFVPFSTTPLRMTCTNNVVTATWPALGTQTTAVVAGDWNYGDAGEWRGTFLAEGRTWSVRLTMDVQGDLGVALTSPGPGPEGDTNGNSDTIVWKCYPSAAG